VLRIRYFAIFGLLAAFVVATAYAQEKKDAPPEQPKDAKKVDAPPSGQDKKADPPKDTKAEPPKDTKAEPPKDTKAEPPKDVKAEPPKDGKTEPAKTEPNNLAWKFTVDKSFYQSMETSTEQNINVMGLDVTQKQKQTFYFKFTPKKQDGDKWEIEQRIEGIKMSIDIAGNPVSFDSTQDNPASGANTSLAEFFKGLKDSVFTLTLNTKIMKVESVGGKEEFLKNLSMANPQLKPLLEKILTNDALKQMADATFGFLPPAPKKVGESWEVVTTLPLGPIGTYTNKYKLTFKGPDEKNKDLDLITVETTLSYAPPTEADPNLPFRIKDSKLVTKDAKEPGRILFNRKLGRLESANFSLHLSGTLVIEIGGNSTTVNLTQNQTTDVKTADESLLPKAEPKKAGTP
jgi:Family of unknown function (DUF6263)